MPEPRRAPGGAKTVYFEAGTWLAEKQGHIHLAIPSHPGFHTTISNGPSSKRHHSNLYKKVKGLLQEHNRWPAEAD